MTALGVHINVTIVSTDEIDMRGKYIPMLFIC